MRFIGRLRRHHFRTALMVAFAAAASPGTAAAAGQALTIASTTSTEQSGLFAHLLPRFTQASGIAVKVVALGTGQAIDMGRRGDADLLFVHDPEAEQAFVDRGFGLRRHPVMYNDFVLVGPKADPARIAGTDIAKALEKIGAANAPFLSRGDKSGTHAAELRFWGHAADRKGRGYRECGCGMGAALNMAAASGTYVLADRGSWLAFRNRDAMRLLVQGDPRLRNAYAVIVVNPARHPHVKVAEAQKFVDWIVSPAGQGAIASYRVDGEPLFFPAAATPPPAPAR